MITIQTLQYGMLPPLSCKILFYICNAPGIMAKSFMTAWKTAAPALYQEKKPGCHKEYLYNTVYSYSISKEHERTTVSSYMYSSILRFGPEVANLTKFGRPINLSMHCGPNYKRWGDTIGMTNPAACTHTVPFSSWVSCHHMSLSFAIPILASSWDIHSYDSSMQQTLQSSF